MRYQILGAQAVAYHARPRATKELDVFVDPTADNAERMLAALREFFGGVDVGYSVDDLVEPGWIIHREWFRCGSAYTSR